MRDLRRPAITPNGHLPRPKVDYRRIRYAEEADVAYASALTWLMSEPARSGHRLCSAEAH